MRRVLFAAPLVIASLIAACAPMSAPAPTDRPEVAPRACFLPQTTVNFTADRDTTAYVRAGRNQVYELQSGSCRGLSAARSVAVSAVAGHGGSVCVGDTVGLTTSGPSIRGENDSQCRAQIVRQLTEAEVADLPGRLRP